MHTKAGLTIPCHWDRRVIEDILVHNGLRDDIGVVEVYGVLAGGGPIGHGRGRRTVVDVTPEEAVAFRNFLRRQGLAFTYLLNAPFSFASGEMRRAVDEYLEWIFSEMQPDAVTITSLELMEHVRAINPDIEIHISTIAGVRTAADLAKYLHVRPSRVVPHHDCGKKWADLRGIADFGRKHGVGVELFLTESCLFRCPRREAHYAYVARTDDSPFHVRCNSRKLLYPEELLLAGGVVRPEEVALFEEMGVGYFKITGRSKPAAWLPDVVRAYQGRSFDGNLIRLLGIDPKLRAEEWICLDSIALGGFLGNFPQGKSVEEEERYAQRWIVKLFREGSFRILDGSKYAVEGDRLVLETAGEFAGPIIAREREAI